MKQIKKFKNISGFPVVLSYIDTNMIQKEIVVYNQVEINLDENIDEIIIHNRLYDNMLKYEWIKAKYDSFDICKLLFEKLEIYISDFSLKIIGNKYTLIKN